jgi:hypothetical protein
MLNPRNTPVNTSNRRNLPAWQNIIIIIIIIKLPN